MKKNTRFAFNAYLQQLARLNGVAVEELSSKFTVEPSVQQTLEPGAGAALCRSRTDQCTAETTTTPD